MPGLRIENYWFARHVACYQWASRQLASRSDPGPILDAGAGEGYGAQGLADACDRSVVAVELDQATAAHIGARYPALLSVRANLVALPFTDAAFEAAVSLQVVEHIWDPRAYLRELARCTRGPIILSTPNRPVHSPSLPPGGDPENPFHVREFDDRELAELLHDAAPERPVRILGLHHGPQIRAWEARHGSLPRTLIDTNDDDALARTLDFAATLDAGDFVIDSQTATAHDLVALW